MNEKKYEFVEEVIRKKPSRLKRFLSKIMSLMGLAVVFGLGVAVILFVLRDNLREILFAGEQYDVSMEAPKINVTLDDGDGEDKHNDIAKLEEQIDRSIVTFYAKNKLNEDSVLLCTGVILALEDNAYMLVPYDKIKEKENIVGRFYDGTTAQAEYWNHDRELGVALLRISKADIGSDTLKNISCAVISNTENLNRGYSFVYEGNPFGQQVLTYTGNIAGISENRELYDLYSRIIYTDIVMDGVEDGFLFDTNANVTGMVMSRFGGSENNSISAIAVYDIYGLLEKMLNKEAPGYLGIKGEYVDYAIKKYVGQDLPIGLYITAVDNTSKAYEAGIMTGDVIVEIGDVEIEGMQDVRKAVNSRMPGDMIAVTLERKMGDTYKEMHVTVTIGERKQ